MRANLPLRLARSAVFATVCVLLAAGAHRFAGGSGPAPSVLLTGGMVVAIATAALAGRERAPTTVVGLLIGAQAFLHQLFGPGANPRGACASLPTGMLAAHLTASLLVGWWLACGEAALWSVLRRIGAGAIDRLGLPLLGTGAGVPALGRVAAARGEDPRPLTGGGLLRHAVVRRGPPVVLPGR